MKRGPGRPAVPKERAKGSLLSVRFAKEEREALERAATREGLKVSEWARRRLLAALSA